jgi:phosphoribosyl-ATP pyrophosphohydrolase/phosphoribosyl-AMP cyclohydrolase
MLAWMDEEAERLTRETGEAWFWSRSRERLWKKGETSGNTLAVQEIREDCDDDALLLRVIPNGPACHTGSRSCFAPELWRTVVERVRERPEGSYVASLAEAGVSRAAQKLGEEAVEAALAASTGDGTLVAEAADVLFHLYVLLAVAGVDIDEVEQELVSRRRQ